MAKEKDQLEVIAGVVKQFRTLGKPADREYAIKFLRGIKPDSEDRTAVEVIAAMTKQFRGLSGDDDKAFLFSQLERIDKELAAVAATSAPAESAAPVAAA